MNRFKYFLVKNKTIIIIGAILLICAIAIAFGIYAQITSRSELKAKEEKENRDYAQLENNFN